MGFSQGIATNVSVLLRNSNIVIEVPIENIIGLPTSEQLRKCDEEFEMAKIKSFKNHQKRLGRLQVPPNLQKYYPEFSEHLLQILYHLSVRCNVKIGFKYRFNRLVFRLLKFGDQIKFSLPQLSEQEQVTFEAFKTKYNDEMVGKVIHCRKARFLPKQSGILKNFKSMSHVEALSLQASFWNRPEHGVVIKKLKNPTLNHLFTDKNAFDALT